MDGLYARAGIAAARTLWQFFYSVGKFLLIAAAIVLTIKAFTFPDYVHRYRLAIEVDTPDGLKRASSVIEIKRSDFRWVLIAQGQYEFRVRADAVFVDLGRGKHVIALLAFGPWAEHRSGITSMAMAAYLSPAKRWDEDAWSGRTKLEGERELVAPLIPTLVTFRDLNDPKTARVVDPGAFEEAFGAGYSFRRATVEMNSVNLWPLNFLAITDPPVTRGIEQKLLWWNEPGRPAYQAHLAMKNGDRTGPPSSAEYLFVRP